MTDERIKEIYGMIETCKKPASEWWVGLVREVLDALIAEQALHNRRNFKSNHSDDDLRAEVEADYSSIAHWLVATRNDIVDFALAQIAKHTAGLEEKFTCGHRKKDWDDSYGECVICKQKLFNQENEIDNERLRAELRQERARRRWAEWRLEHYDCELNVNLPGCCQTSSEYYDERHGWKFEQWLADEPEIT